MTTASAGPLGATSQEEYPKEPVFLVFGVFSTKARKTSPFPLAALLHLFKINFLLQKGNNKQQKTQLGL